MASWCKPAKNLSACNPCHVGWHLITWMALSITSCAICGATTLIMAISFLAACNKVYIKIRLIHIRMYIIQKFPSCVCMYVDNVHSCMYVRTRVCM